MVTGASTAELALILVDARKGPTDQSRRHAAIAKLLGIPQVVVCVNKMDLVGYDEGAFDARRPRRAGLRLPARPRRRRPSSRSRRCTATTSSSAPSGSAGTPGRRCSSTWRRSPVGGDPSEAPARLPVQYVIRADERRYAGQVAAGVLRVGDDVVVLPGGGRTRVTPHRGAGRRRRGRARRPVGRRAARGRPRRRARRADRRRGRRRARGRARAGGDGVLAGRRPGPPGSALPAQAHHPHRAGAAGGHRPPAGRRDARARRRAASWRSTTSRACA